MMTKTMGIAFSAILLAGAFALAATGAASAESVMKQCGDDWKAAKAAGTTNGQTWQEFLKTCKAQKEGAAAPAAAAPAAPAAPAAAAPTPAPAAARRPRPLRPPPLRRRRPLGRRRSRAGEARSRRSARRRRPPRPPPANSPPRPKPRRIARATPSSGSTPSRTSTTTPAIRSYGTTKQGAYMCEADAKAAGNVAAKGEKEEKPK